MTKKITILLSLAMLALGSFAFSMDSVADTVNEYGNLGTASSSCTAGSADADSGSHVHVAGCCAGD